MIGPKTIVVQNDEPVAAVVDGETVMMSVAAGAYFGLNGVGSEIWNMLETPTSVSLVCDSLRDRYEVNEGIDKQVEAFIEQLLDRGLVLVIPS